jgi:NAD(P)-dependent dehydrogenase (short-subunit alcohol dehydrogenase family)
VQSTIGRGVPAGPRSLRGRVSSTGARVAVVTGGAGAIGGAIGRALAASGHRVVSFDRQAPGPDDLEVDLADPAAVDVAAGEVLRRHGRCDVLVHAAADLTQATLAEIELTAWRRVQAVNVEAAVLLVQSLAPALAASGHGRVVLIGSDTFWQPPSPALLAYVASKGALVALTRGLAHALGPDGIAVTCVAPGLTDTPAARTGMPDSAFTAVRARQALDRTLVPDDVAATVAFLVTDAAAALTGQTISVDGGTVMP